MFDRSNEKQVLKFKDELAGTPNQEFCALKPKLYSIVAGEQNKMSAKGTKKFAQLKLNHEMFKQTLQTDKLVRLENVKFTSERHQIQTVCVNKIAISAYDDKRYIMEDKKTTLPFGLYLLTDEFVSKQICNETEWGIESNDSEESVSVFDLPEGGEASGWETPDPGFHQPLQTDEELNDVIDFSALSDVSDESDQETPNPFILSEAEESFDTSTSSDNLTLANYRKSKMKRKEKSFLSTERDFSGDQSNSDLSEG